MTVVYCPICDGRMEAKINPGEPIVMYYPDSSGYPGSPPGVEIVDPCSRGCYDLLFDNAHPDSSMPPDYYEELIMDQLVEGLSRRHR